MVADGRIGRVQPNKRLKLAGVYRSKGKRSVVPLAGHGLSSTTLARAGESPAA